MKINNTQPHLAAIVLQILLTAFVEGVREEHHGVLHCATDFGDGANLQCSNSRVNSMSAHRYEEPVELDLIPGTWYIWGRG